MIRIRTVPVHTPDLQSYNSHELIILTYNDKIIADKLF